MLVCLFVCRDNDKITQKEMLKLFSCDYDHYNIMKCRRNMNFEEMDTEPSTGKNDGFCYFEEHLRSIPNKILLWQC